MKKRKKVEMARQLSDSNRNSLLEGLKHLIEQRVPFAVFAHPNEEKISLYIQDKKESKEFFLIQPFEGKKVKIAGDHILSNDGFQNITTQIYQSAGSVSFQPVEHPIEGQESFEHYVSELVEKSKKGKLKKAVAAAIKNVPVDSNYDFAKLFLNLFTTYNHAFVHLSFSKYGLWIGATPEILIEEEYTGFYKTMSLAGTRKVNSKRHWTIKEFEEQAIVTDYIFENLYKNKMDSILKGEVETVNAGNVVHLCTEILFATRKKLSKIAKILHPTPAVCGFPKKRALKQIKKFEKGARSCYSGYLGPVSNSEKRLYVNLRCMNILNNSVQLFVGAGITSLSDPKEEWKEVEAKANTLLNIL